MASETAASPRPWLDELTARYGESRITSGPVLHRGKGGAYVRESWSWFPGGKNHHLVIDRYAGQWAVRAMAPGRRVTAEGYDVGEPTAAEIRAVLVLAGMLEASDG